MVAGRQKDDGNIGMAPDHPAPMEAIVFRELNVDDDKIRFYLDKLLEYVAEICHPMYLIGPL
jgi:hypothetical protein